MINKPKSITKKRAYKKVLAAPLLFSLPLGDYSDEMEKKRDKKLFLKLQHIEKELQSAKELMAAISSKHQDRMNACKQLVGFCRGTANSRLFRRVTNVY